MHFDAEGHVIVTPREVHEMALASRAKLINNVLLPGTPRAIPTHAGSCDLLQHISDQMGIHPNNLFFRGSTKIGFSIAPKAEKIWMEHGPASDLDLAIVDHGYFQIVDNEVRRWEWQEQNRGKMFQNQRLLSEHNDRNFQKGKFDCFRFFGLPRILSMERLNECLASAPVAACCGIKRPINAFIFRDWWGVCKRYDYDLHLLRRGLNNRANPLPSGGDEPCPYLEEAEILSDGPEGTVPGD